MIEFIRRGFLSLLLVTALALAPSPSPTVAAPQENLRYAAIVVDAQTGEVLFSRHADARRYPASITKVMTLYLAFEALAEGRVRPDDVLTISPYAASMPPSKLGLAAGQTITLDDAMRATAVRSSNDMAVAIAEHLGGSESRFAAMMTLKAQQLGMNQTRYVNANGLPDSRQLTTARDLSILSRAVMRDFPQYYSYFGLHDWAYQGRDYRNTNGLLRDGRGYDGLKTGFTNASGYNLAASAVRDGRRLVTIVLGGRSSASRNAHVAELMDTGFDVGRARERGQLQMASQNFFEQRGFGVGAETSAPVQYASVGATERDEGAEASSPVPYTVAALSPPAPAPSPPAALALAMAEPRPSGNLTASLNGGAPGAAERATTPAPRRPAAAPARPPAGRWAVQVGAFRDQDVATDWLTEVNRRFRTHFNGSERQVQNASGWYRSRFTGLTEDAARGACEALAERRVTCMIVRPD